MSPARPRTLWPLIGCIVAELAIVPLLIWWLA